jgi:hypothetical protein
MAGFDLFGAKTLKKAAASPPTPPPVPSAGLDIAKMAQESARQKLAPQPTVQPSGVKAPKKKTSSQIMSRNMLDFES